MNKQIITLAIGSKIGNPDLAPIIPIKAPIEERASDLWCHASAITAPELIFFAADLVNQYIHSFVAIDTIAATIAIIPGIV